MKYKICTLLAVLLCATSSYLEGFRSWRTETLYAYSLIRFRWSLAPQTQIEWNKQYPEGFYYTADVLDPNIGSDKHIGPATTPDSTLRAGWGFFEAESDCVLMARRSGTDNQWLTLKFMYNAEQCRRRVIAAEQGYRVNIYCRTSQGLNKMYEFYVDSKKNSEAPQKHDPREQSEPSPSEIKLAP